MSCRARSQTWCWAGSWARVEIQKQSTISNLNIIRPSEADGAFWALCLPASHSFVIKEQHLYRSSEAVIAGYWSRLISDWMLVSSRLCCFEVPRFSSLQIKVIWALNMWVVCLFITSTHTYKRKSWFLMWTVTTRAGYPSTEIPESKVWIRLDDSISQHVGFDHVSKHDWEKDAGWAPLTSTNRASSTPHCKFIKAPPQKPAVLPKRKTGSNSAVIQVYSFSLHLTESLFRHQVNSSSVSAT